MDSEHDGPSGVGWRQGYGSSPLLPFMREMKVEAGVYRLSSLPFSLDAVTSGGEGRVEL